MKAKTRKIRNNEGLEKIDDETDALDITMVKVNDARYAKKFL